MAVQAHPDSLLGCLAALPDPRRRQGRRYPLSAILGLVLMGMLHGRDSLRGGWVWARQHWGLLWRPLGGRSPHFPAYNTVRTLLLTLDADDVDRRLQPWLERLLDHPLGGVSADGKVLRGSKRDELPALHVVSLVAHDCASILAQRQAADGDEVAALLTLLTAVPLAGRIISMDAGLLTGAVTQTITRQEGEYIGMVKGNNPEVLAVLDEWVATAVLSPLRRNGSAPAGRAGPDCATATETVSVRSAT
jgi:DDE_Tnp_1-associated